MKYFRYTYYIHCFYDKIVGEQLKGFSGVEPLCLGPMPLGRTSWQWDKIEKTITLKVNTEVTGDQV